MSFFVALTLIFITLKLIGVIAWSWWWVLAPLYPGLLFIFAMIIVIIFVAEKSKPQRRPF